MPRPRLRDLGISIGRLPPGPHNAISDVPDVLVGHHTLIADTPRLARTGVTVIVPRAGAIWHEHAFAGYHCFNGNGEMTGLPWLLESGLLSTPVALTNTHAVGAVRDALMRYGVERAGVTGWLLPVVSETYDGWLSDIDAFHVTGEHALAALAAARGGPVAEGNVGGGTGMRCHELKGGIGTASRVVAGPERAYTVGVLVQANYGRLVDLRVDGVPVGARLAALGLPGRVPEPPAGPARDGSIVVVIATDAPLLPAQCARLARRATAGLARAGGKGYNGSGDLFLAFATGNRVPAQGDGELELRMLPHARLDPFFDAVVESVEESILNALCAAETMTGRHGTCYALPLEALQRIMGERRMTS